MVASVASGLTYLNGFDVAKDAAQGRTWHKSDIEKSKQICSSEDLSESI